MLYQKNNGEYVDGFPPLIGENDQKLPRMSHCITHTFLHHRDEKSQHIAKAGTIQWNKKTLYLKIPEILYM